MRAELVSFVHTRAKGCCEYCLLPCSMLVVPCEIDHIIAIKHRGPTEAENLALACFYCNSAKGSNIAGLDPEGGRLTRLFHPRGDQWPEHFFWSQAKLVGLTDVGRELVHECNRLGIILDVSHINPAGFWDMIRESAAPIIATHSSVKAISPHVRNLDDDQIRALAAKGGTIGINFANIFLRPDMQANRDTPLDVVLSHFEYIVNLVGDEHVSFGSDFDGTDIPDVIRDAEGLPLILRELQRRGYGEARLERICNGNFLRVAEAAWK